MLVDGVLPKLSPDLRSPVPRRQAHAIPRRGRCVESAPASVGGAPDGPGQHSEGGQAGGGAHLSGDVVETELRTFLIADIRGYTTFTRERGDEAAGELAGRFAALVREVVAARNGFLLELRGDEALVVFVSARQALRAAIELQERFTQAELPRGVGSVSTPARRCQSRAATAGAR